MKTFAFTVDDIALEDWSSPAGFEAVLRLLEEESVKATFFVVPTVERTGKSFDTLDPAYVGLLRDAHSRGHEIAQHGLNHNRFEIGIPPQMVLDLPHEGPAREFVQLHQAELLREHTVDKIRRKLAEGRRILEDKLGFAIRGFRAPALQSCVNFFAALEAEGYAYDSSVALQPAGWDYICGNTAVKRRRITPEAYREAIGVGETFRELPLTTDYTWELTLDRYAATRQLALDDIADLQKINRPPVFLSHVVPLFRGEDGCGVRLAKELFAHLKKSGAVSKTLSELC